MPVESLDPTEQLLVVPEGDEDLCVVPDGSLQDGERTLGNLVLFKLSDLELGQLGFWQVEEFAKMDDDRRKLE